MLILAFLLSFYLFSRTSNIQNHLSDSTFTSYICQVASGTMRNGSCLGGRFHGYDQNAYTIAALCLRDCYFTYTLWTHPLHCYFSVSVLAEYCFFLQPWKVGKADFVYIVSGISSGRTCDLCPGFLIVFRSWFPLCWPVSSARSAYPWPVIAPHF